MDAGEKSRFITQLQVEYKDKDVHKINPSIYNAVVPEKANQPMVIPKSESVMARLKEIAESGFSPTDITSYIRNPIQFYYDKILSIVKLR
jgi:hypothetical protein